MLFKRRAEKEIDRILDACLDTGVGISDNVEDIDKYYRDNNMELEYTWFGIWLFDNVGLYKLEKDIEKYNQKELNGLNSREASYQVYTKYYKEYQSRNKS